MNNKLKDARKRVDLTQSQVAEKACVAERTYQEYEYGKRKPSVETAIRIAKILNSTVEDLFGAGTPNKSSTN